MISLQELKQKLLDGEVITVGYNSSYADAGFSFEDHGCYSDTSYGVYYDDGKYHIHPMHFSDDGDCIDGEENIADSFDDVVYFLRRTELKDCPIILPFGKFCFDKNVIRADDYGDHGLLKTFSGTIFVLADDFLSSNFFDGRTWKAGFFKVTGYFYSDGRLCNYDHYVPVDDVEFIMLRGHIFKFASRGNVFALDNL